MGRDFTPSKVTVHQYVNRKAGLLPYKSYIGPVCWCLVLSVTLHSLLIPEPVAADPIAVRSCWWPQSECGELAAYSHCCSTGWKTEIEILLFPEGLAFTVPLLHLRWFSLAG